MLQEKLKNIRKQYKYTQQEIADALKIDRSTYAYYENGRSHPTYENLIKLCKIFNVESSYFLGEDDDFDLPNGKFLPISDYSTENDIFLNEFNRRDERQLLLNFRLLDEKDKEKVFDLIEQLNNEGI